MQNILTTFILALAGLAVAAPVAEADGSSPANLNSPLEKRTALCYTNNRCQTVNAQAIVDRVIAQGTSVQQVGTSPTLIYTVASCCLRGHATKGTTSSYRRDIGYGAREIVNTCKNDGHAQGVNTAGGNGNFVITLRTC